MATINEYRYRLINYFTGEFYECNTIRTLFKRFDSLRREYKKDEPHDYHLVLIEAQTERVLEDWSVSLILKREYLD